MWQRMLIPRKLSVIPRSKKSFDVTVNNKFLWENKKQGGPRIADYLAPAHGAAVPKPGVIPPTTPSKGDLYGNPLPPPMHR